MSCGLPSTISEVSFGSNITSLPGGLKNGTLKKVTISENNPNFTIEGNGIYDKDKIILKSSWGQPTSFRVADGVKTINSQSLAFQYQLVSIELSGTVEEIERSAFEYDSQLRYINLGNNLKKISGDAIFKGCNSLKTVEIPSSIENIHSGAFSGWNYVEKIYVHKKNGEIKGTPWGAVLGDRAIIWDE